MSKQNESGNAKNIANFARLIAYCTGYGPDYNPSTEAITITELQKLYERAVENSKEVALSKTAFNNATNARALVFENNSQWATRILNAFVISGADKKAIGNIKEINRKIQGLRAGSLPEKGISADGVIMEDQNKHISVSQKSYDSLLKHFNNLLSALSQEPAYKPNETDITIDAIAQKIDDMNTSNNNLNSVQTQWSNLRIKRHQFLYGDGVGMLAIAQNVKKYIKSLYSASSPQFKQISGLLFKDIKG